jgi:CelD/BcsL family acetyltransferase involved in cellulose biosynthesis
MSVLVENPSPAPLSVSMGDTVSKALQRVDPLKDARWEEFLEWHPRASIFHTTAWLKALRKTYGYTPIVYTTSSQGDDLHDGLVVCEVESWLTGRRLVSLPFSDHCEPLVDDPTNAEPFFAALQEQSQDGGWLYIEMRPQSSLGGIIALFHSTETYFHHRLDLRPDCDALFRGFHKDSIQRKIRRAEREGILCSDGPPCSLLESFYGLNVLTRRRHGLPPQPRKWFRNLIDCFGDALKIRVAFKGSTPIAAILTLRYKDTVVYKYGCSDPQFYNLGGIHLLFWKTIQEAKDCGLRQFDLGRSDADNSGLITFKDRWGATSSTLTYLRYAVSGDPRSNFVPAGADWKLRLAKRLFARTPKSILPIFGNLLYRHIG